MASEGPESGTGSGDSNDTVSQDGTESEDSGFSIPASRRGLLAGIAGVSLFGVGGASQEARAETLQTTLELGQSYTTTAGQGIELRESSPTGFTYGVRGIADSPKGRGVFGDATSKTGANYGLWGRTASKDGTGLQGTATSGSGSTIGVRGVSKSPDGIGLQGSNTASQGRAIGLRGATNSPDGLGVFTPDDLEVEGQYRSTDPFELVVGGDMLGRIRSDSNTGDPSTVAFGKNSSISGSEYSAIGGGKNNEILSSQDATIGGGEDNRLDDSAWGTIAGGDNIEIIDGPESTIGGGYLNEIRDFSSEATIAGGEDNTITGNSDGAAIGGGDTNTARSGATNAVISGGESNLVYGARATVGGGLRNESGGSVNQANVGQTVAGGIDNKSNAQAGFVGGGEDNRVDGAWSVIPGGRDNRAQSDDCFAAGRRAKARDAGSFIWADSENSDFESASDQIRDGDVDAAFVVGGWPVGAIEELAQTSDINIVEVSGDTREGVKEQAQWFADDTIPAGTYEGIDEDVETVSVQAMIATHEGVDEEVVENVTAAIFDNVDGLNIKTDFISKDTAQDGMSIELHAGADAYFG